MLAAGSLLLLVSLDAFGGVGAAGLTWQKGGAPARRNPAPTSAGAMAGPMGAATARATVSAGATVALPLEAQRRRDLEDLQRQAVAAALAQLKVTVEWREHRLAELVDWRDRVEVATLLAREQGLTLDWRGLTLAELNDIRLRSAKAAELSAAFGVAIDWRLYSWRQLEEIRRAVARIQGASDGGAALAEGRQRRGRAATGASAGAGATTASPAPTTGAGGAPPRARGRDIDAITEL